MITQAYTSLWQINGAASKTTPDAARQMLAPYAAGGYLTYAVDGIKKYRRSHREAWGHVTVHVIKVATQPASAPTTAQLQDCQDASQSGLADSRTHKLVPGTRGPRHIHLQAKLRRGDDGRWRVTSLYELDSSCSPDQQSSS